MTQRTTARVAAVIGATALSWLSGCAATGEGPARSSWRAARVEHYEPPREDERPAGVDPAGDVTLEALIALAETRNPGLRAAFDRWTAALERVPQARSLPDPKLSYAYFIEPVETRVGPQRQKIGIAQTIPLFGKLGLRGEVAVRAANAAGARFEAARRELRYRITKLWNDYYYLRRALAVTERNVQLLVDLENVALARYTAGEAHHAAVIRAQVELGRIEDRLRTLGDERAPILAALNAELSRDPATPIAWPDTTGAGDVDLSDAALREALLEGNPELAALAAMQEKEEAAAELAGRSSIPDLTIGAEYIQTDEARFAGVGDSGKDAAVAMASVNVPLWFGRYRAEKAEADARARAIASEHEQLRNRLLADLERARFELRDADRRVDLYAHTLLPRARQALQVTEDAFTAGTSGFLELIDSQRTLLEFELAHERAVADRATRRARLEQLVGTGLDREATSGGDER